MLPLRSLQNRLPTMIEIGLILALLCSSCMVVRPQETKTDRITCALGNPTDCPQSPTPSGVETKIVEESGVSEGEYQEGEEKKNGLSAVASAKANKTVTADAEVVKTSANGVTITLAAGAAVGKADENETESEDTSDGEEELPTIALKAAIQDRDIDAVAQALKQFDNVTALAEGFKFDERDRDVVLERTPARNDADVVAIKGIARAALDDKNFVRLADVIVLSLTPEDGKFPAGYSAPRIKANLLKILPNKRLMRSVLTSDPATTSRRRLLVDAGSPANSMFCAYCWKRSVCRRSVWWCK